MAKEKDDTTTPEKSEIPALGVTQGVDSNLAFTTPFRAVESGVAKNNNEKLVEVGRQDEWRNDRPNVRQLTTMRRMDGQARALYRLLTLPIRAALKTATFVPAEGGEEEAEFITTVFETAPENGGMTVTFQRFMSYLLMSLFDGFAAFEKVFWTPEFGPLKGKITLQKLAYRPSDTITFITDEHGGFEGMRQRAVKPGGKIVDVYIPRDYSFYYAAQEEENKFYGVSFFESAFYHYDMKVKLYYTAHLAAQRAAVGTRLGTTPPNASAAAKTEFAQMLANLSLAQWMMMPEGFKVEVLKEGGGFDFLSIINHHDSQMSKSILAAFFDESQGKGAGEGSLVNFAQPGDDMFILMLRAIMDDIADQINHYIIPQLIDLNFKGGKYPIFTWGTLTDEQKAAISATFDKLATAGQSVNATKEFVRALEEQVAAEMGLEIDYEEVAQREAEEAEMAAQGLIDPATGMPLPPPAGDPAAMGANPAEELAPEGADITDDPDTDWTLEEFEEAMLEGESSDEAEAEDDDEEPDPKVALSTTLGGDLIALAQGMLDAAREESIRGRS